MNQQQKTLQIDEKVVGIVDELHNLGIYYWVAFITNRKRIIFMQLKNDLELGYAIWGKGFDLYRELEKIKKFLNKNIEFLNNFKANKIIITKENQDFIQFKKNKITRDVISLTLPGKDTIKLKSYRKQFNILFNILNKNMEYSEAIKNSGFDFARIKFYFLILKK